MIYRDLASFGLRFVTPQDPFFASLVEDIRRRAVGPLPDGDVSNAAVLLNESGEIVLALSVVWKFAELGGHAPRRQLTNLGSGTVWDALAGVSEPVPDRFSFVVPGSKRLITEDGFFGDNSDVLPPEPARSGGVGWSGIRGGGGWRRQERPEPTEMLLDLAFFEDGLCAGPDESGLFDSVSSALASQRAVAQDIVDAIRDGAPIGQLFEMLRPLAQQRRSESADPESQPPFPQRTPFGRAAIEMLINHSQQGLPAWFARFIARPRITLHRA